MRAFFTPFFVQLFFVFFLIWLRTRKLRHSKRYYTIIYRFSEGCTSLQTTLQRFAPKELYVVTLLQINSSTRMKAKSAHFTLVDFCYICRAPFKRHYFNFGHLFFVTHNTRLGRQTQLAFGNLATTYYFCLGQFKYATYNQPAQFSLFNFRAQ